MEQLALHGPVKDNQAVVAATSYPFHLAPVVDKNHSNLSSPSKPIHLVLGQRWPSGKSREAGRPGNSEDRQPTQAALADNNPHDRSIAAGRQLAPFGRTYKDFISELHLYLPPKIPQQNIPHHNTHFQFTLCCIISYRILVSHYLLRRTYVENVII